MSDFLTKCGYESTAKQKLCPITEKNCWGSACSWWDKFTGGKKPSGWCTLPDSLDPEVLKIVKQSFDTERTQSDETGNDA